MKSGNKFHLFKLFGRPLSHQCCYFCGWCIILDMTLFPISINYYSSSYPSFILWGKGTDSLENIFILLTFPLYIFWIFICASQSHVNENSLWKRQWNNIGEKKPKNQYYSMKWGSKESAPTTDFQVSAENVQLGIQCYLLPQVLCCVLLIVSNRYKPQARHIFLQSLMRNLPHL